MERIILSLFFILCLGGCSGIGTSHNYTLSVELPQQAAEDYKNGQYSEAIDKYEFLVIKVPEEGSFWFALGNAYLKNKQITQAKMAYENAVLRNPELSKAWYNLGLLHLRESLRVFMEMQEYTSSRDPVKEMSEKKLHGLMKILK